MVSRTKKPRVRLATTPLDVSHLRQHSLRYALAALFIILTSSVVIWLVLKAVIVSVSPAVVTPVVTTPVAPSSMVKFAAMGDMLGHDSVVAQAKTATGYDFAPYFESIRPLYADADVVFCNQEGLVSGEAFGISGYPAFNSPSEFAEGLSRGAGCNVVNLANNHIGDKNQAAIDATIDVWTAQKPLALTGANKTPEDQKRVAYFTKNGIKFAFVAFADFNNNDKTSDYSVNLYHDQELVEQLLEEARKNADFVIVSAHWGTEDDGRVDTDQEETAQLFADLGADIVIGTGPHVLQKVSYVNGQDSHKTLVWYSLGNMLNSQLEIDQLTGGIAGFSVTKTTTGITIDQITFQPTFMSYRWSAADRAAQNLLARSQLRLQPLRSASDAIVSLFPTSSVAERTGYVQRVIGSEVDVTITP